MRRSGITLLPPWPSQRTRIGLRNSKSAGHYAPAYGLASPSHDGSPAPVELARLVIPNRAYAKNASDFASFRRLKTHRHFIFPGNQFRRDDVVHIGKTGLLFGAAWQCNIFTNLLAIDQDVAGAFSSPITAERYPQRNPVSRLDRHVEREPAFACTSVTTAPEKRHRVLTLFIEVSLRLHLARLGKRYRGSLNLLLLLLLDFIFGGTLGPLVWSEDIPIDCVFPAREFVERRKLDVPGESNTGCLKPSGLSRFRLEPLLQRFFGDDDRGR